MNLTYSNIGFDLTKHFEELHDGDSTKIGLQPKLCPANIWTCGYGHVLIDPRTGRQLKGDILGDKEIAYQLSDGMTVDEAQRILLTDIARRVELVRRRLKVTVNQNQFDALVDHVYNCGVSETLFKRANNKGDVKEWFLNHYITANGVKLNGLIRRRYAEWYLYNDQLEWMNKTIMNNKDYKDGAA